MLEGIHSDMHAHAMSRFIPEFFTGRIIAELNPMLRGWFNYFKHARFPIFRTIDGFVRRRLRALLRKREKRPSFGGSRQDHQRWPNAFFAAHGLFTLHEAYV
jgi:RNA-directed DNA polymerase